MGCGFGVNKARNNYSDNSSGAKTGVGEEIKEVNRIMVNPAQFVREKIGVFRDHYKLGRVLGSGAFGEVRKCIHRKTGDVRAVKILRKNFLENAADKERFMAEIDILKQMDHPNIVKLYEFFQDEKRYFLVTELCKGGELFEKIIATENFSEIVAAKIIKQLLSAVVYCHSKSIVHRDLKPENLLLESRHPDSQIKVIDFGTSQVFDPEKKMNQKYGTPYYIAPEVLKKNYNEKCDVWSCGVILYILLCGYPPFAGKGDDEILQKVSKGVYSFEGKEWDHISLEAKNLIKMMLTIDPKKRCTAECALNHPWIKKTCKEQLDQHAAEEVLLNLKGFTAGQKLQQAALTFIVSQMATKEEKAELQKVFSALDKNNDGKLSRDELMEGFSKIFGSGFAAEEEVDKIMREVDNDHNGYIDYTEFILATINKKKLLSDDKLEAAFNMFDKDGNGSIDASEIKDVLGVGSKFSEEVWIEVVNEVDQNGDGEISFKEFKQMMQKIVQAK